VIANLSILRRAVWCHARDGYLLEVSNGRRTQRNRDASAGRGKQDKEIYTKHLRRRSDGFGFAYVRHGHSEEVCDVGTSRPQ